MGSYLSTIRDDDWRVFRRSSIDDQYAPVETQRWNDIIDDLAFSRFKHEVFAYTVNAYEYVDTKTIYLYKGSVRCLKAEIHPEQFHLTVSGLNTHVEQFARSPEALGVAREKLIQKHFVRKYNNRPIIMEDLAIYALRDYSG